VVRQRWDLVVDIRGGGMGFVVRTRRRAVLRRRPGPKVAELGAMLKLDPPPLPVAWIAEADRGRARALLPLGRPIAAFGPTAAWPPKAWPGEHFAALWRMLAAGPLPGAVPVILAGPGEAERAMAAPLLAALPGAVDLCGGLSLPEAAACLSLASLYVGNDSGLMHLAAATGAPTLVLFGPTPASEYAPVGRCTAVALSPTGRMGDLSPEDVLAQAIGLLATEAPAERLAAPAAQQ
jgi:ADP-heptose:LPS heptosyltransferase